MKGPYWILIALLIAVAWLTAATAVRPSAQPERVAAFSQDGSRLLGEPDYLPEVARMFLHEKMHRHGKEMERLVRAVLLLRYPLVEENARHRFRAHPGAAARGRRVCGSMHPLQVFFA